MVMYDAQGIALCMVIGVTVLHQAGLDVQPADTGEASIVKVCVELTTLNRDIRIFTIVKSFRRKIRF
uniref:hypothetical protein n=1 Tax=Salmonella enterica TaxID=28901 RepID=UPI003A91A490